MLYDSGDNYIHTGMDDNSVRMTKNDELSDFSSQSILSAMDRFVKAVNNMNETVMVPCRLLDMEVNAKGPAKVPALLRADANPYNFYAVLNTLKNDLIWGPTTNDDDEDTHVANNNHNNTRWTDTASDAGSSSSSSATSDKKGHFRRQSTLSMISMSSNASDGGDSEASEGGDSGVDGEDCEVQSTASVTASLRTHLMGLHACLNHLTDTATFIADRYQEDVNI